MLLEGIMNVIGDPTTMLYMVFGVFLGIAFGAVPGLSSTMAVSMCLPLTYAMTAPQGLSMLVALFVGGVSGGLISAILLNIPGTPSSIATTFDGAPMARKGLAGKALGVGILFSFLGTVFSTILLVLGAPVISTLALKFSAFEYCAVVIFSLSLVVTLCGADIVKGLIGAVIGLMLSTVGMAPVDSTLRFTFDATELNAGLNLVAVMVGLFAVTEVIANAVSIRRGEDIHVDSNVKIKGFGFSLKEFKSQLGNGLVAALVGTGIGILPGIGGSTASMLGYTVNKNRSKHSDKYGTGIIDGVVSSETANNAMIGGAMMPLLTLGIPGDAVTALLLGGMMIHGITPGPLIFEKSGAVVYSIYTALLVASFLMLIIEFFGIRLFIRILKIPKHYLFPVIMVFSCIGAFANSNRMFEVWSVLVVGVIAYAMSRAKIPFGPLILGFILGPMLETYMRRITQFVAVSPAELWAHPVAIAFVVLSVGLMIFTLVMRKKKAAAAEKGG